MTPRRWKRPLPGPPEENAALPSPGSWSRESHVGHLASRAAGGHACVVRSPHAGGDCSWKRRAPRPPRPAPTRGEPFLYWGLTTPDHTGLLPASVLIHPQKALLPLELSPSPPAHRLCSHTRLHSKPLQPRQTGEARLPRTQLLGPSRSPILTALSAHPGPPHTALSARPGPPHSQLPYPTQVPHAHSSLGPPGSPGWMEGCV